MNIQKTQQLLQIDLYVQITIIAFSLLILLLPNIRDYAFITFYFGLGAFQIISYLFHLKRRINSKSVPEAYTAILIGIIVIGLLTLFSLEFLIMYLFLMLLLGIIMAFTYIIITISDLKSLKNEK